MHDCRAADRPVVTAADRWLGGEGDRQACVRFQQLSAPLAAKAVEDTAYYRYGVLLSRNEVGADIARFAVTAAQFHAASEERRKRFPDAMLATATHDHKRGADVRARLAVLSEMPGEWEVAVRHWLVLNTPHRRIGDGPMPTPGDEAMLYQMIVGAWPTQLATSDATGMREYAERLAAWQLKSLREAKLATDWTVPNLEYEDAAESFLYTIMADAGGFATEAANFAHRIGPAGAVNGLAQILLKLTAPGVPDLYQGTDLWDLSLVDPDNRGAVDFERRITALRAKEAPNSLAEHWRDALVKQALIQRALALRQERPALFARGSYAPVTATGPMAAHVVAFVRSHGSSHCLVVVPRLPAKLLPGDDTIDIPAAVWDRTTLHLPHKVAGAKLRDAINGGCVGPLGGGPRVGDVLRGFPVALLTSG
jgi:(1->4)-alpha-D-glucan 1-alpha-D-glucosylmutase